MNGQLQNQTGETQSFILNFRFYSLTIKCGSQKIVYLFNGAVQANFYILLFFFSLVPKKTNTMDFSKFIQIYQQRA